MNCNEPSWLTWFVLNGPVLLGTVKNCHESSGAVICNILKCVSVWESIYCHKILTVSATLVVVTSTRNDLKFWTTNNIVSTITPWWFKLISARCIFVEKCKLLLQQWEVESVKTGT